MWLAWLYAKAIFKRIYIPNNVCSALPEGELRTGEMKRNWDIWWVPLSWEVVCKDWGLIKDAFAIGTQPCPRNHAENHVRLWANLVGHYNWLAEVELENSQQTTMYKIQCYSMLSESLMKHLLIMISVLLTFCHWNTGKILINTSHMRKISVLFNWQSSYRSWSYKMENNICLRTFFPWN